MLDNKKELWKAVFDRYDNMTKEERISEYKNSKDNWVENAISEMFDAQQVVDEFIKEKTPQQALDETFDFLLSMTPEQLREYAKQARESGDSGDLYNCMEDNGWFERNEK